jgi:hypothetical protein
MMEMENSPIDDRRVSNGYGQYLCFDVCELSNACRLRG